MRNVTRIFPFVVAMAIAVPAFAALLGVVLGLPNTSFSFGTTTYTASSGRLAITATPLDMNFGGAVGVKPIGNAPTFAIDVNLDTTGAIVGGAAGPDLTLTGSV